MTIPLSILPRPSLIPEPVQLRGLPTGTAADVYQGVRPLPPNMTLGPPNLATITPEQRAKLRELYEWMRADYWARYARELVDLQGRLQDVHDPA